MKRLAMATPAAAAIVGSVAYLTDVVMTGSSTTRTLAFAGGVLVCLVTMSVTLFLVRKAPSVTTPAAAYAEGIKAGR
ncbi:hypothetical protein [Planotetraspora phitsanulokensis]|uniref:Uncharacterized protein n=1 Tax=Planotetraspora phitsanulokensis TaxID=575192 RepID=A0A8J3UQL2_9ACTN|nr:hypothetical protein [Planotetraspora phitsanulokensis]GII42855.1 hypothetical protein Pph01_78580 [Planotetraspora phitsanulokensis]